MKLVDSVWARNPIIWIHGVRKSGKTSLGQIIPGGEYFDCSLPWVRDEIGKQKEFLEKVKDKKIVIDEIQRLANPLEILKIAGSHLPSIKLILISSSRLQASPLIDDPLVGKIAQIGLTPMMSWDLIDFGNPNLPNRFLKGGLPPFFLSPKLSEYDFHEWIDSFWAKDIQEPFRIERRSSLQRFLELLFLQSGGLFEASRFAGPCEVSRPTIGKYLSALEATGVIQVIRPFSTQRSVEIIAAPKTYGFDTGFLCYFRGWQTLREDDFDILWKHYVLNEIRSHLQSSDLHYWRDKRGHEVDFVLIQGQRGIVAITAQWRAKDFEAADLQAFRYHYPGGHNWIVCQDVKQEYIHYFGKVRAEFISLEEMGHRLSPFPTQAGRSQSTSLAPHRTSK